MQFNPANKERYAAVLRNIIANRLINEKDILKNLKLLKIISVFSALNREKIMENVNLPKNIQNLLNKAYLKYKEQGKFLNFAFQGNQNYQIDYNLLKLLILELVSSPIKDECFFKGIFLENRIIFVVKKAEQTQIAKALIKKLNGIVLKERTESNFAVMLSAPCILKTEDSIEDTEDFKNPFSTVNIMLFR